MKSIKIGYLFVASMNGLSERADYLYVKNQAIGKGIW